MKILFAISIAALLILHMLPPTVAFVPLRGIENHAGKEITTSGIAKGKRICSDSCVRLIGANESGPVTVRGRVVKTAGEALLFVRRIE